MSYVCTGMNVIVGLTYTPVMIRLLGQNEYGLYSLAGSVVSYLSLFSLGFLGAYFRFYFRFKSKDDNDGVARLNGMFLSLFLCISVIALIFGNILVQFTPQILGTKLSIDELLKAKILMRILVINIALTLPSSLFDSIIGAYEKFIFQRIILLAGTVLNPLIGFPLLLMGYDSVMLVVITTFITIFKLLINIWFCINKLKVPFAFRNFNFGLLKEIAGFSFFLFVNMLIDQINWSIDKFILGRISGTAEVAIYSVGTQFNNMFMTLSCTVSPVFGPQVNKIAASDEETALDALTDIFTKVGRIQFILSLYLFVGYIIMGRLFIMAWAGNEYEHSFYVAFFLMLAMLVTSSHNLGIEIRRAKNKHRMASIILLITAMVNLFVSIPLAAKFGAIGSALGTSICVIASMPILDLYYTKVIGIRVKPLYKNIGKILLVSIIPITIGIIGTVFNKLLHCLLWEIVYTGLFMSFLWKFGLNDYEKGVVKNIKKIGKNEKNN